MAPLSPCEICNVREQCGQLFCPQRGRQFVWEDRQAVIAGGGISSGLLFALSQLTVKIIQFQIIRRCSFHVEKSERHAKLSLLFSC